MITILLALLFCTIEVDAQRNGRKKRIKQRFKAGAVLGLNMTQIDGDKASGYHQIGVQGGVRGVAVLTRKIELSMELLFSQKGSQSNERRSTRRQPQKVERVFDMKLNYVEVPILINFRMGERDVDYYIFEFQTGFSYGRLLDSTIEEFAINAPREDSFNALLDQFNENDFAFVIGGKINLNKNLGIGLRHFYALNTMYESATLTPDRIQRLRNYFLNTHIVYMF